MGLDARKSANNKGAEQPAHPRSLISAFLFAYWKEKYMYLYFEIFLLAKFLFSVVEESGLSLTLSETPKTGFIASRPI